MVPPTRLPKISTAGRLTHVPTRPILPAWNPDLSDIPGSKLFIMTQPDRTPKRGAHRDVQQVGSGKGIVVHVRRPSPARRRRGRHDGRLPAVRVASAVEPAYRRLLPRVGAVAPRLDPHPGHRGPVLHRLPARLFGDPRQAGRRRARPDERAEEAHPQHRDRRLPRCLRDVVRPSDAARATRRSSTSRRCSACSRCSRRSGSSVNGAHSWILLPAGFSVQPSEFAKVALCVGLAMILAERADSEDRPSLGLVGDRAGRGGRAGRADHAPARRRHHDRHAAPSSSASSRCRRCRRPGCWGWC